MSVLDFTAAETIALRKLLDQAGNVPHSVPGGRDSRDWTSGDSWQTPEVYVALVPLGGIPALYFGWDPAPTVTGTGSVVDGITGTGPQSDRPGSAECQIWKIVDDGTGLKILERVGNLTQTVYNLSTSSISQQWVSIHKTKFGHWIVSNPRSGGSGCDTIRFCITSADEDTLSVTAEIRAWPNGCTIGDVPDKEPDGTSVIVCDPVSCFFNEPASELLGRRGWARYMIPGIATLCQPLPVIGPFNPQWEVFSLCCPVPRCEV